MIFSYIFELFLLQPTWALITMATEKYIKNRLDYKKISLVTTILLNTKNYTPTIFWLVWAMDAQIRVIVKNGKRRWFLRKNSVLHINS